MRTVYQRVLVSREKAEEHVAEFTRKCCDGDGLNDLAEGKIVVDILELELDES